MLARKKQKQSNFNPRPPLNMNLVKLNSFLFKKQKQKLSESVEISSIPHILNKDQQNHRSLRIRFKSQIIENKEAEESENEKVSSSFSGFKQTPHNLTLRILKWSKLKKKTQPNRFDHQLFKDRIRRTEIPQRKTDIEIIKCLNEQNSQRKFGITSKRKPNNNLGNQSQTMKIIDSYKLTQRIVFYQQLQQRKDKQKSLQDPLRILQMGEIKSGSRVMDKQQTTKVCRPWSGQSVLSGAHE